MKVVCYNTEFDIPDFIIEKFIDDFKGLPGSGNREPVLQLRASTEDILDLVAEEPEILEEAEYLADFIRAVAVQEALRHHGLLYDA